MRTWVWNAFLMLWIGAAYGGAVEDPLSNQPAKVIVDTPTKEPPFLDFLANHGGWVNPEDLMPMPQCIAQQDQSAWLSTMTKCISKICINHFGFICTHHQWLIQVSCLSVEFSPDVIRGYISHCSRSILAKAQLYNWVLNITSRTWLVDVGDTNGMQRLSPASLIDGFAAVDVVYKAPACLTDSASVLSMELFQHALASCGFTSTTQHTGNRARPWEYNESLRSMVALDSETAGHDLTGRNIPYGDYFDKHCFCEGFTIDQESEPCAGQDNLDLTRQRLWTNATCGPTSLPGNWTDALRTTEFAYIDRKDWRWPKCLADMPQQVTSLTDRCATDACEVDHSGYCNVKRAVDRSCFCNAVSYDICEGSCHVFETRIDYVQWLHDLCGNVDDWHGLPRSWRRLADPTAADIIPWRWKLKLTKASGSGAEEQTCTFFEWQLASLALLNAAPFLAIPLAPKISKHFFASHSTCYSRWLAIGFFLVALHLLATSLNIFLVQQSPGYESIPTSQLLLLWSSRPQTTWLAALIVSLQASTKDFCAVSGSLAAGWILQMLASYYMLTTVQYGYQHDFYSNGLNRLDSSAAAKLMYIGALLWLIIMLIAIILLVQALCRPLNPPKSKKRDGSKRPHNERAKPNLASKVIALFNEKWTHLEIAMMRSWARKSPKKTTLINDVPTAHYTTYGTLETGSIAPQIYLPSLKAPLRVYSVSIASLIFLWIAQSLFWGGFLGLGSESYCPPKLAIMTVIWTASSLMSAVACSL